MPPLLVFLSFIIVVYAVIAMGLRYNKAVRPIKLIGNMPIPSMPSASGIIRRLDGVDRHNREIKSVRIPSIQDDGVIGLPLKWSHDMSIGRVAITAHTWALSRMMEDDMTGGKEREKALRLATIIPLLSFLVLCFACIASKLSLGYAIPIWGAIWAFMSLSCFLTQMRETKAAQLAEAALKESGLWPQDPLMGKALSAGIKAAGWARMGGFRRVLPR